MVFGSALGVQTSESLKTNSIVSPLRMVGLPVLSAETPVLENTIFHVRDGFEPTVLGPGAHTLSSVRSVQSLNPRLYKQPNPFVVIMPNGHANAKPLPRPSSP